MPLPKPSPLGAAALATPAPERPREPAPGHAIGGYRLLRCAGAGAASVVYHAVHEQRPRCMAAFKLMRASPNDSQAARRFDAETRILRTLSHPDIVRVFDAGHWCGRPWIAMQWLPGHDLTRYTAPSRLLPEAVVIEIGARLAFALAHAHEQGVLHRDIKPGNVRVHLPRGQIKLADFGAGRLEDTSFTPTGVVLGSPAYMAPEVLAGAAPDTASDLYALGVVLYELLSGRRPFQGDTMGQWLRQLSTGPPPHLQSLRPELPGALVDGVMSLLERQPRNRPGSARRVGAELQALHAAAAPWCALDAAPPGVKKCRTRTLLPEHE
jgi:serine/threonine-protein kinase